MDSKQAKKSFTSFKPSTNAVELSALIK
jgi:hypothetical protein